jgi:hypothetical protein
MPQPLSIVDDAYKVVVDARPSNYLVNHISFSYIPDETNWTRAVLVRKTSGFPITPDDGERIFTQVTDSIVLQVIGITASTGAVASFVTAYYPETTYTASTTFSGVISKTANKSDESTPTSKGSGATFSVTTDSNSVPTVTLTAAGSGYAVNDVIRIPGYLLGSRSTRTELGVSNLYHVYDKGTSTAVSNNGKSDANPGYGVTGQYAKGSTAQNPPNKYYYSLFVQCYKTTFNSDIANDEFYNIGSGNKNLYWRKVGEVSCPAIIDKGTVDNLLAHLPSFYTKNESGTYNNDLKQFLSLFAFHLDTYLSSNDSVFNLSDIDRVDEILLKEWLTQLGGQVEDTVSLDQLRTFVKNITATYAANGSVSGVKKIIEAYGGYNVSLAQPINIITNYDSSSFLNSTGNWYPDPDTAGSFATNSTRKSNAYLADLGTGITKDTSTTLFSQASYKHDALAYYGSSDTPLYETPLTVSSFTTSRITSATATTGVITYNTLGTPVVNVGDTVIIDGIATTAATPVSLPYYNTRGVVSATAATALAAITTNSAASASATLTIATATAVIGQTVTGTTSILVGTYITAIGTGNVTLSATTASSITNESIVFTTNTFSIPNYNNSISLPSAWTTGLVTGTYGEAANGIIITVADTTGVNSGDSLVTITSPSGLLTFTSDCVVTDVIDKTRIQINRLPKSGFAVSGDTIAASNNLRSRFMKIQTDAASSTNVSFILGVKRVKTTAAATSSNIVSVKPGGVAAVGDYVIDPVNNAIPTGSKVVWISEQNNNLNLVDKYGKNSSVSLTSGAELWFSDKYLDKTGAITQAIGVEPNQPYSFGAYITATTTAALRTATAEILWYDKNGTFISTATASSLTVASQTASVWTSVKKTALSPSNAMYATPKLTITNATSATPVFVDGAMFARPMTITARAMAGTTASIYTREPHNFTTGFGVVVYGADSPTNTFDGGYTITNVSQDPTFGVYSFSYTVGTGVSESFNACSGYAASVTAGTGLSSNFKDATRTRIKVLPSRINLLNNPYISSASGSGTADTSRWTFTNCASTIENTITASGGVITLTPKILSTTGTSRRIRVTPGMPYSFSGYVKDIDTGATVKAELRWYTVSTAGSAISTSTGLSVVTTSGSYVRPSVTEYAPATALYVNPVITTTASVASTKTMVVERFLFENSPTVGTYFDGDFDGYSFGTTKDSSWALTTRSSPSYLYNNLTKASALIDKTSTDGMYYA